MSTTVEQRRAAFLRFHEQNPAVFERLVFFARQAKEAGRKRIGMRLLIERCRWEWSVEIRRTDEFRINDHVAPQYVRLLSETHPELASLFKKRERKPKPTRVAKRKTNAGQDELFGDGGAA